MTKNHQHQQTQYKLTNLQLMYQRQMLELLMQVA